MSTVIGWVHGGTVRAEFMESVLGVLRNGSETVDDLIGVGSGPNISRARNLLVSMFLEDHQAPWLWMLDTDMMFGPDTLDRLLNSACPAERPIVGALCMTANGSGDAYPTMYEAADSAGTLRYRIMPIPPDGGLVRVGATGAACLLAHRAALDGIRDAARDEVAPWFREDATRRGLVGEDITFCQRAQQAGIPVHVHAGIHVGHIKPAVIWAGHTQQLGR